MQARAFNTITIQKKEGSLIKSSSDISKLKNEINYYLNIPSTISFLFPELIKYNPDYSSYTVEYIPYRDLSEIILENELSLEDKSSLLVKLFDILDKIHASTPLLKKPQKIYEFYTKKTLERIDAIRANEYLCDLDGRKNLIINDRSYKTFQKLEKDFKEAIRVCATSYPFLATIHGDFSFGNILYCTLSQNIKLIDPRGSFITPGIYGHPLYDYAKLLHCIHGQYDQIVSGKYQLIEQGPFNFTYNLTPEICMDSMHEMFCKLIYKRGIEKKFLYLIEASLFLSMSSLHYEDPKRQKALFLRGIIILNDFFEKKYENLY